MAQPSSKATINGENDESKIENEEKKKLRDAFLKGFDKFVSNKNGNRDRFVITAEQEKKPDNNADIIVPTKKVPLSAFRKTSPNEPEQFVEIPKHCPFLAPYQPETDNETKAEMKGRLLKQTAEERHATSPYINTLDFIDFLCNVDLDEIGLGENEKDEDDTAGGSRPVTLVSFPPRPRHVPPPSVDMEYEMRAKAMDAARVARGLPVEPDCGYKFGVKAASKMASPQNAYPEKIASDQKSDKHPNPKIKILKNLAFLKK